MSSTPLYPSQQYNVPCPVYPACPAPTGTKVEVLKGVPEPKPFNINVGFETEFLKNLHGSVYIDPTCAKDYPLIIKGEVQAFANLSTIRITPTSTSQVTATTNVLTDGTREFVLSTVVPLRVNDVQANVPIIPDLGWNFRSPTLTELPVNHLPVTVYNGQGSTAGDIYFTVDASNFSPTVASVNLSFDAINYNNNTTNVALSSADTLSFRSESNGLTVTGNNTNDTINFGLRIDGNRAYNDIENPIGTDGLFAYHIPEFFETTTNTSITVLDSLGGAYPVGTVAVWSNNNLTTPLIVRKTGTVSPQWQALNTNIGFAPTPTAVANILSNVLTVTVPLRINTTLNTMSVPASNGQGYVFQSSDGSLNISDLGTGIMDWSVNSIVTVTDTSTLNLTPSGNNISGIVPMRVNGVAATLPSGSTAIGFNMQSSNNTIDITNPSAGNINLEVNLQDGDTSTVSVDVTGNVITASMPLEINSTAVSVAGTGPTVGYNILSNSLTLTNPANNQIRIETRQGYTSVQTDAITGGSNNLVPTGNDLIIVNPSVAYTSNRTRTLDVTGVQNGDTVTFSTLELTSADIAVNNYIVTAAAGPLLSVPVQLQPNSFYEFVYNSTAGNWIRTK